MQVDGDDDFPNGEILHIEGDNLEHHGAPFEDKWLTEMSTFLHTGLPPPRMRTNEKKRLEKNGTCFPIQFGTKVLSERHQGYAQVKRELWGIVSAVKVDKDYLIGIEVVIERDCLPILGMVSGCATPDLAMLRWIAYIKSLNSEIRHISGKDYGMADMLS